MPSGSRSEVRARWGMAHDSLPGMVPGQRDLGSVRPKQKRGQVHTGRRSASDTSRLGLTQIAGSNQFLDAFGVGQSLSMPLLVRCWRMIRSTIPLMFLPSSAAKAAISAFSSLGTHKETSCLSGSRLSLLICHKNALLWGQL